MSLLSFRKNNVKGTGGALGVGSTPTVDWGLLVLIGITGLVFVVVLFGQKFLTIDSIGVLDEQTNVINSRGIDSKKLDQALKILDTVEVSPKVEVEAGVEQSVQ